MKQEEGEKEGKRKGRLSITARFPQTESPSSSFKFWSNLRKRERERARVTRVYTDAHKSWSLVDRTCIMDRCFCRERGLRLPQERENY